MSQSIDAQAADNFGGKHGSDCNVNRRAGYTDPLGWALRVARKGGTLAAGEGLLLVKHYEALVEMAYREGATRALAGRGSPMLDWWLESGSRRALEER